MIEITKTVPVPNGKRARMKRLRTSERVDALSRLEVDESFWCKGTVNGTSSLLWWADAKFPERLFLCAAEGDGVRIWRTK